MYIPYLWKQENISPNRIIIFATLRQCTKQFLCVTDISFIVHISIFKWESAISTQLISTYIIIDKLGGTYKMENIVQYLLKAIYADV